jgi:hypothetical protein
MTPQPIAEPTGEPAIPKPAPHPAMLALADHIPTPVSYANGGDWRVRCACRGWDGWNWDHPAHLTEVLEQAGLLKPIDPPPTLATCRHCDAAIRESPGAFGSTWWRTEDGGLICGGGSGDAHEPAGLAADGTSPETPTTRVLAERADRRTT